MSAAAASSSSGSAAASAAAAGQQVLRTAVPTPTWVPIVKTSLSSWRAGPTEAPASSDAKPRNLYVVRCANVPKSLLERVLEANGVSGPDASVVEMAAPRVLAKGTMTPGAGPADPSSVSPPSGMSPGANHQHPQDPAAPPPLEPSSGGGVPAMSLGPALEEQLLKTSALTCVVLRDRRAAEDVQRKVSVSGGDDNNVIVDVVERPCPATCTVVLKGVPLTIKHERLWQELTSLLSATPAYLRFHRNDRGLFKNVVYVRFASPIDAELGRMELERFSVGGRPLKVEFKKPKATSVEDSQRAEAARREDLRIATQAALESYVEQLAKSADNEAFTIPKAALNKDETRYLRGVAQAQEFNIDIGSVNITVKKRVQRTGASPGMGPARTPPFHPATPSTHAADADAAAGMLFRGIRHWRDQRSVVGGHSKLGHMHTLGPADGTPAWSAGRGRPSKC